LTNDKRGMVSPNRNAELMLLTVLRSQRILNLSIASDPKRRYQLRPSLLCGIHSKVLRPIYPQL
jgi:hypothetical protein